MYLCNLASSASSFLWKRRPLSRPQKISGNCDFHDYLFNLKLEKVEDGRKPKLICQCHLIHKC